jgi:DNA-binding response OmpR family regulator
VSTGQRGTVLIVEDNVESAALMAEYVEGEGFKAAVCETASEAMARFEAAGPVAVLLDWGLPDRPGIEVCRLIRARNASLPILFVSGRGDETSIVRGLDAGADDYIAKPVRPGELLARLEAHLRRASALQTRPNGSTPERLHPPAVRFGPLEIDLDAREVRKSGRPVKLGALEFKLLAYLLANAGTAVSRDQILAEVYGYDADIGSERVDLLVRRLRSKLGEIEGGGLIVAVAGYGYRLDRRGAS